MRSISLISRSGNWPLFTFETLQHRSGVISATLGFQYRRLPVFQQETVDLWTYYTAAL